MGRGPLAEGRPGSGGAAATRLGAAVRAGMDAGDDSGHRRRFAVIDLGLTGVKTVGIEGVFLDVPTTIPRVLRSQNSSKREPIFRFLSLGFLPPHPISISVYLIAISSPFPLRFWLIWRISRKSAIWGGSGQAGIAGSR
ncbi:hypothetical protein CRG98_030630 [Punica granatum]|uniref:Uncharacterized protein n=1 Tax=Punica granatum TaxID=22663 RepID=A0A2I0IYZ2_PUNGR|nr:hypothetical protein CRG98_030630 [Punica granatum]